jgi:predicted secreted protein
LQASYQSNIPYTDQEIKSLEEIKTSIKILQHPCKGKGNKKWICFVEKIMYLINSIYHENALLQENWDTDESFYMN